MHDTKLMKWERLRALLPLNEHRVPFNDMDAWGNYPAYRHLYNKMYLCEFQNVSHAPMPIRPDSYPVIVKPITNLCGMGLDSHKVVDEKAFERLLPSTGFWSEYHDGQHCSHDLVLFQGEVVYRLTWVGEPGEVQGTFSCWRTVDLPLPVNVLELIEAELNDFTGMVNIETIFSSKYEKDIVIEMGLRTGDLDKLFYFQPDCLKKLLEVYWKSEFQAPTISVPEIYILPVWGAASDQSPSPDDVEHKIRKIYQHEDVLETTIVVADTQLGTSPPGVLRLAQIICASLECGLSFRRRLLSD